MNVFGAKNKFPIPPRRPPVKPCEPIKYKVVTQSKNVCNFITLAELLESVPENMDANEVTISTSSYYDGDCEISISWQENVEDTQYEVKHEKYLQKLAIYEVAKKVFDESHAKYVAEKLAWETSAKEREIAELTQRLATLRGEELKP